MPLNICRLLEDVGRYQVGKNNQKAKNLSHLYNYGKLYEIDLILWKKEIIKGHYGLKSMEMGWQPGS